MKKLLLSAFAILLCNFIIAQSWIPVTSAINSELFAVHFADDNIGYVAGLNGKIAKTTDGGTTWTLQTSTTTEDLRDIYFLDASKGFAVGYNGAVVHTMDGGATWMATTTNITTVLRKVLFTSSTNGWIVGDQGTMLRTTDGGTSWMDMTSSTVINFRDIIFVNANDGYTLGTFGLIMTNDGGNTWNYDTLTNSGSYRFNRVKLINNSTELIAVTSTGSVLSTIIGSSTWAVKQDSLCDELRSLDFINDQTGWAIGLGFGATPEVFKTTDGGSTWVGETAAINEAYDVEFRPNGVGYVVGAGGVILRYGSLVGVDHQQQSAAGLSLYPNPANDVLNIQASGPAHYTIIDAMGRKVLEVKGQAQTQIDVSALKSGIYFVRADVAASAVRFVKQ